MRRAITIGSILCLAALSGCTYGLRKYNVPSQEKLCIRASAPTNCVVRVADTNDFPVAADGRVSFEVPRLPRGCDVHLFGIVKLRDGGPENVPAIHVLREDRVVRKLSLSKLGKLPVDEDGYHILVLK